jgi:hypothetical protein
MGKKDRDAVARGMDDILGGADILSNVISNDRERFGREEHLESDNTITHPDNNTSHTVIQQYDNNTIMQPDTQTDKQSDMSETMGVEKHPVQARKQKTTPSVEHPGFTSIKERAKLAAQMTDGPTTTITLRIPAQMNEWLDEYVHRAWPKKIKKQDLVIEALQMLIARRLAAGETPTPTKLLLDESEPHD